MRDDHLVVIWEEEIEYIDEKEIRLKESRSDVEWGEVYRIELNYGEYIMFRYGFFGYRRDRVVIV